MDIVSIIPARGGSKGIPKKNLFHLAGKPLIAHSIEQATKSETIERVVVSTDDEEIAAISAEYGADVIWRPIQISGDKTPSEEALKHVLSSLSKTANLRPELVVFLQATSPCRLPKDIDGAVHLLLKNEYDSVFSACREHFTGRWRINRNGFAFPVNFELGNRPMRQDYPLEFLENGSIYVFRPWVLHKTGNRLGGRIGVFEMPALRSFQLDHMEDLSVLEMAMVAMFHDLTS